jgi:predicted dienelactone hydrolase
MVLWRPQDVRRTVDALGAASAAADGWLAGLVDASAYAVMGHSFGGYTSLAVAGLAVRVPPQFKLGCDADPPPQPLCAEVAALGPQPWQLGDPRCALAVPLAPAGYGWGLFAPIKADAALPPILVVGATGDTITPASTEQVPIFDDLPGQAALFVVKGSNHYVFSDICALAPVLPKDFKQMLGDLCEPTATPPVEEVHAEVAARALAAARLWLLDQPAAAAALLAPAPSWATLESKGIASAP